MIEAAEAAIGFLAGRARSDLDDDRMLFLATIKAIEIFGEAASRLSASTRENSPDIPWGDIIGMRNRLTHVYFDVNSDIVWQSTTEELPELLSKLRALLGEP
ncbi:MAG TPA: HepT-like ribonuclease domain-containing protein [Stellaceae bacterium]|nr:HepT-like ribonuclease domain-containing protein [Stellaceae bacterium]